MTCYPCPFCARMVGGYAMIGDASYGNRVYETDCGADAEWNPGDEGPCPCFLPILSSESLYEQLYCEDEYAAYCSELGSGGVER